VEILTSKKRNGNSRPAVYLTLLALLLSFTLFAFNPGKVSFEYSVNGLTTDLNRFSVFVMPGYTVNISFTGSSSDQYVGNYAQGQLIEDGRLNWQFVSPRKEGNYELVILHNNPPETLILNIFVMTPLEGKNGEYLNGYRIGNYPTTLFRNNPKYKAPEGLFEVTRLNQDVRISPHFRLKQFLCKQQPGHWPKYVLVKPELIMKLELVIERLHDQGIDLNGLFIMSGYRTPYYNTSIGNGKFSRHQYGDAADVYVDSNHDSVIDDLNKDGKASMADADVIYQVVEAIESDPKYKNLIGGMGKYRKTAAHTWDVHTDMRGYRARW